MPVGKIISCGMQRIINFVTGFEVFIQKILRTRVFISEKICLVNKPITKLYNMRTNSRSLFL